MRNIITPTPLGDNWGWKERAMEIATFPLYVISLPLTYAYRGMTWLAEKWWNM